MPHAASRAAAPAVAPTVAPAPAVAPSSTVAAGGGVGSATTGDDAVATTTEDNRLFLQRSYESLRNDLKGPRTEWKQKLRDVQVSLNSLSPTYSIAPQLLCTYEQCEERVRELRTIHGYECTPPLPTDFDTKARGVLQQAKTAFDTLAHLGRQIRSLDVQICRLRLRSKRKTKSSCGAAGQWVVKKRAHGLHLAQLRL